MPLIAEAAFQRLSLSLHMVCAPGGIAPPEESDFDDIPKASGILFPLPDFLQAAEAGRKIIRHI